MTAFISIVAKHLPMQGFILNSTKKHFNNLSTNFKQKKISTWLQEKQQYEKLKLFFHNATWCFFFFSITEELFLEIIARPIYFTYLIIKLYL